MHAILVIIIFTGFSLSNERHYPYPTLEACQDTLRVMKLTEGDGVAYCIMEELK